MNNLTNENVKTLVSEAKGFYDGSYMRGYNSAASDVMKLDVTEYTRENAKALLSETKLENDDSKEYVRGYRSFLADSLKMAGVSFTNA